MHRTSFLVLLSLGITLLPVGATAQTAAGQLHAGTVRAQQTAASYQVQIVPTSEPAGSTSIEEDSDAWAAKGYDLRSLIALIYGVDGRQVDFANQGVATARFDISATLPEDVDPAQMKSMLADAIERRFGLEIAPQTRTTDVYVLTAPNGPGAAMKRHVTKISAAEITGIGGADEADDAGKVTLFGQDCTVRGSSEGIEVEASTMADFQRTLEPDLDRVLVDETHLTGSFDFKLANYANQQELFWLLHDQLGLVVTPAQRDVTVLAVRPSAEKTQAMQAQL